MTTDPAMSQEPEWWKAPDDEDVMEGAELMELLADELEALIRENELDVYAYQSMVAHGDLSEKRRLNFERWVQYHQARVRQLKLVHARLMTRKLPSGSES